MAHPIKKTNENLSMKFHNRVKNFKRIEKINFGKHYYKLFIDKNDSVYDIYECQVNSWKTILKGKKKISVPDQINEIRSKEFFNIVKGNPFKIAYNKILTELEYFTS